jgi:hypothetical protein
MFRIENFIPLGRNDISSVYVIKDGGGNKESEIMTIR